MYEKPQPIQNLPLECNDCPLAFAVSQEKLPCYSVARALNRQLTRARGMESGNDSRTEGKMAADYLQRPDTQEDAKRIGMVLCQETINIHNQSVASGAMATFI